MDKFFEKLKKRWHIQHNWEILPILAVFAITGTSTVYLYSFIKGWVGISPNTPFYLKVIAFTFLGLPLYNVLLIIWGKIFGQGDFFVRFVKQFFARIFKR